MRIFCSSYGGFAPISYISVLAHNCQTRVMKSPLFGVVCGAAYGGDIIRDDVRQLKTFSHITLPIAHIIGLISNGCSKHLLVLSKIDHSAGVFLSIFWWGLWIPI